MENYQKNIPAYFNDSQSQATVADNHGMEEDWDNKDKQ